MSDPLDRRTATFLTVRYAVALAVLALLAIVTQVVIQSALARQAHDAEIINLAGRQRMLSQRLCKTALAWQRAADAVVRAAYQAESAAAVLEWSTAHQRLTASIDHPGMGADNSPTVATMFAGLAPVFAAMQDAVARIGSDDGVVATLLANEPAFLRGMDAIVQQYDEEAQQRVRWLSRCELALTAIVLATLIAEALLVFRPAVRRIKLAIADRERMRQQEMEMHLHEVAGQVSRDIGQDLHDGLGQRLTAVAFQAKALSDRLAAHPESALAREVMANVNAAIVQSRSLARRLAPVDIEISGLEGALVQLASDTAKAFAISCTASWDQALPRPDKHAVLDLYRIVQEAVTNAIRHGRARTVAIAVSRQDGFGVLTISDDGRGKGDDAEPGFGLTTMHYRAQRLGGSIDVTSNPTGGMHVCCRWPLSEEPRRGSEIESPGRR